jgi:hypothetical protein
MLIKYKINQQLGVRSQSDWESGVEGITDN